MTEKCPEVTFYLLFLRFVISNKIIFCDFRVWKFKLKLVGFLIFLSDFFA